MTDERVREALHAEAAEAPDAGDLWERTTRRIRRRRAQRWGGATAVVLMAVAVTVVNLSVFDERREVVLGDAAVPQGWHDVAVADAVVSVPPDWQVVDVTTVRDRPAGDDPLTEEPIPERDGGERAPANDPDPCPRIDPDRPVLVYSEHGSPQGCPDDPDSLTGLVMARLETPPPDVEPEVFEAGERVVAGAVPTWAVPTALVTGRGGGGPERAAAGGATTLIAPGLDVAVEVRRDGGGEAVEAVLETLRPYDDFDAEGVLQGANLAADEPGAPPEDAELVGWAIDAGGDLHRWLAEPVGEEPVGAALWPAATASRFGAAIEIGDETRVVTGRPGDDAPTAFPLPDAASLESVVWSPAGEAVAWLSTDPEPRLGMLGWGDPDRLADGAEPERIEVAVTGLPDPGRQPFSWVVWERDDEGERLEVRHPDEGTFAAAIPRDGEGGLDLADPIAFEPR